MFNYDEIFQEPTGLPPKREIQHEIHLQQDAPLPNVGMYKFPAVIKYKNGTSNKVENMLSRPLIVASIVLKNDYLSHDSYMCLHGSDQKMTRNNQNFMGRR